MKIKRKKEQKKINGKIKKYMNEWTHKQTNHTYTSQCMHLENCQVPDSFPVFLIILNIVNLFY